MKKRSLLLVVTHTLLAAGMFAWGWWVAHGRAGAAASGKPAADGGPVRPAKLGAAAQKKTEVGKEAARSPGPEDPGAFVAWAKALVDGSGDPFGDNAACHELRALFHRDQERALQIALLAWREKCGPLFRTFAYEWGMSDLPRAVAWAKGLETEAKVEAFGELEDAISSENASQAAASLLPELPRGDLRDRTLRAILTRWSGSDPDACFAWVRSLPIPDMMSTIPSDPRQSSFKWIDSLPADVRLTAEGEAIGWLDGPRAAERVTQLLAGADATAESLPKIAWTAGGNFARENPPQAAEWVGSLPAGKVQREAAAGVVSEWAKLDPGATSQWVATLPEGAAHDGAAAGLADALATSDPEAAFTLAASVGSEVERIEALRATVHEWKKIDPTAARRTIEASGLAAAEKAALLGPLGRE